MNCGYRALGWLLLAASCYSLGCFDRSDRPTTFPVKGRVIYEGKPVADASVAFLAPGAPAPASGTTDKDGNFTLSTFAPHDGAVAGTHVATVNKFSLDPAAAAPPADIETAMQQQAQQIAKAEKSGSVLPQKYAEQASTDLRFDVVDGENFFEIRLTD
jgi:hypothetical protein